MKRSLLSIAVLGAALLATGPGAHAQAPPFYETNWAKDYVGTNVSVTAPASIARTLHYSISNDGSTSTNNWGGAITTPFVNVAVVKAVDSLGNIQLTNGTGSVPSLVGKIALIYRGGGITFTQKAQRAQVAGAIAVVIVNNVPGGPVGMANTPGGITVTIPVLMISDVDGAAINSTISSGQTTTMSIYGWGTGQTHDISIVSGGDAISHAYALPLSQLGVSNGNPIPYKNYVGAFIANLGTAAKETNIKLVGKTTFTPTGGAASPYFSDSVTIDSFRQIDSVFAPRGVKSYDVHATTTGRFDLNYTLSMTNADQASYNNVATSSMYVTDSVFSKSRFDFTKGEPIATTNYGFATAQDFVWGPMYYVAKGDYAPTKIQFTMSTGGTAPDLSGTPTLNVYIFKWEDANGDHVMQASELTVTGVASKDFSSADTPSHMFTVAVKNPNSASPLLPRLADNSWYWVAADMPSGYYLGCDGQISYYPRVYDALNPTSSTDNAFENFAPLYGSNESILLQNGADTVDASPFEGRSLYGTQARFSKQKDGLVPSIAMHISKNVPTSVATTASNIKNVSLYPNPASTEVNISISLDKPAKEVWLSIADGMGRVVRRMDRLADVQNGQYKMSTGGLAAGQYYFIINADDAVDMKKFTIIAQ